MSDGVAEPTAPVSLRGLDRAPAWELADAGGAIWKAAGIDLTATAMIWFGVPLIAAWGVAAISPFLGVVAAVLGCIPGYAVMVAGALDVGTGRTFRPASAIAVVRSRARAVAGASVIFLLCVAVTFGVVLLFIGRLAPMIPVVLAEDGRGFRRSFHLTRGRLTRATIASILSTVPGLVIAAATTVTIAGLAKLADAPVATSFAIPAFALLTTLAAVLVLPWMACTAVAIYLAGRQRIDGLDLQMQLRDALRASAT